MGWRAAPSLDDVCGGEIQPRFPARARAEGGRELLRGCRRAQPRAGARGNARTMRPRASGSREAARDAGFAGKQGREASGGAAGEKTGSCVRGFEDMCSSGARCGAPRAGAGRESVPGRDATWRRCRGVIVGVSVEAVRRYISNGGGAALGRVRTVGAEPARRSRQRWCGKDEAGRGERSSSVRHVITSCVCPGAADQYDPHLRLHIHGENQ